VLCAIGLSILLVGALWLLTHQTIGWTARTAVERAVDVDLAGLVDIYASGGEQELVRRIEDRLALISSEGEAAHYMLASNAGRRLAGDVPAWPALSARRSQAGRILLSDGTAVQARATQLGPDLRLLVAREFGDSSGLLRRVALVFLGGGGALVLAVGLLGRMAGARLSRRIGRINQAFREPAAQPLDALGEGDPRDEIDELARHSAAALDRQKRLVEAYREASDQVAHEIRTPLMHLDNKLVKVLKALPDEDPAPRLAETREDIRHMVHMLESLLDIAASKARRGDRSGLKPVDLSRLVRRIGDLYAASAEESGHAFSCEVEPGIFLEGEETQLTRLVTNLLDNALKYVPAGGSVDLELAPGPVLTVRDDGPGIPANERDSVFGRFRRGSSHAGDAQGKGLGLTLARAIAERHGLAIRLADTPKGACFVVSGETA
jgi:signal transduction histidine kinase